MGIEDTGVPCTSCARLTFSIVNSPYAQNQPFLSSCMLTDLNGCRDLTGPPAWAVTLQPILNTATRGSPLPHESWAQSLQSRGPHLTQRTAASRSRLRLAPVTSQLPSSHASVFLTLLHVPRALCAGGVGVGGGERSDMTRSHRPLMTLQYYMGHNYTYFLNPQRGYFFIDL